MARPKVTHDGFLIPNAAGLTSPRMAEPDQVDFNTLASPLWGVVEGCLVTVAGATASCTSGLAIVNGVLVTVNAGSAPLGFNGSQDRFDLLAVDGGGTFQVITGTPAVDPVFPDPPLNMTVLAAVFCPTGSSDFSSNVIDKRKFVNKALLTKIPTTGTLIQNTNGAGNHFLVEGDGTTVWEGDATLLRSAAWTLRVKNKLVVDDSIRAQGLISGATVTADGLVTGNNLGSGTSLPATAPPGALFQDTGHGRVYMGKLDGTWEELVTVSSANPLGTIITSMQDPSVMMPMGWVPLDGRTVSESAFPKLFTLPSLLREGNPTGSAPNRSMTLPDLTHRFLTTSWAGAGVSGGNDLNQVTLSAAQMAQHRHNTSIQPGGGASPNVRINRVGPHSHSTAAPAPGDVSTHTHSLNDPGHNHNGAEWIDQTRTAVIAVVWGGQNKIDAMFNDRNHTYSVEALDWIAPSTTDISIGPDNSQHGHLITPGGDHDHVAVIDPIPAHTHVVAENDVGVGAPIDITPSYLTTYTYIRS